MYNSRKKSLNFRLTRLAFQVLISSVIFGLSFSPVLAVSKYGVHVLAPREFSEVASYFSMSTQQHYVTVPLALSDLDNLSEWQASFDQMEAQHLVPIIRLVTKFEQNAWQRPLKKDLIRYFSFMAKLNWPAPERLVIVFNEVNHASEWGGLVDAQDYAQTLRFTLNWAHTEPFTYKILPAGLDLAAPNSGISQEAFGYLEKLHAVDSTLLADLDAWNSHSYPNPGFTASPETAGQNTLRGFELELQFLKLKTGKDMAVFITETGWRETGATSPWLNRYYRYAADYIWSHPQVVAVTPFLWRGSPGPFSEFSLMNESGQLTAQGKAYQEIVPAI